MSLACFIGQHIKLVTDEQIVYEGELVYIDEVSLHLDHAFENHQPYAFSLCEILNNKVSGFYFSDLNLGSAVDQKLDFYCHLKRAAKSTGLSSSFNHTNTPVPKCYPSHTSCVRSYESEEDMSSQLFKLIQPKRALQERNTMFPAAAAVMLEQYKPGVKQILAADTNMDSAVIPSSFANHLATSVPGKVSSNLPDPAIIFSTSPMKSGFLEVQPPPSKSDNVDQLTAALMSHLSKHGGTVTESARPKAVTKSPEHQNLIQVPAMTSLMNLLSLEDPLANATQNNHQGSIIRIRSTSPSLAEAHSCWHTLNADSPQQECLRILVPGVVRLEERDVLVEQWLSNKDNQTFPAPLSPSQVASNTQCNASLPDKKAIPVCESLASFGAICDSIEAAGRDLAKYMMRTVHTANIQPSVSKPLVITVQRDTVFGATCICAMRHFFISWQRSISSSHPLEMIGPLLHVHTFPAFRGNLTQRVQKLVTALYHKQEEKLLQKVASSQLMMQHMEFPGTLGSSASVFLMQALLPVQSGILPPNISSDLLLCVDSCARFHGPGSWVAGCQAQACQRVCVMLGCVTITPADWKQTLRETHSPATSSNVCAILVKIPGLMDVISPGVSSSLSMFPTRYAQFFFRTGTSLFDLLDSLNH